MVVDEKKVCDVLVVGAGPVGLVAGIDLAQRGHGVIVVDERPTPKPLTVRCNHVSARSMEFFRRLGFADDVRAAGLPDEYPHSVSLRTSFTGFEIGHIPIAGRSGRRRGDESVDSHWPTLEPPHRINQIHMEPVMMAAAQATSGLELMLGARVDDFSDDGAAVSTTARRAAGDVEIEAKFLVGCDGARSAVRKGMGAAFEGDPELAHVQASHISAPGLIEKMPAGPAWGIVTVAPDIQGTSFCIDGESEWMVNSNLRPGARAQSVPRDVALRRILGVDENFPLEIISEQDWVGRRLVTTRMRKGRVFLAGDAAHVWIPFGGYGMNAGIADAMGLGWLLDAVLRGWGGEGMLDAYAAERHPITGQVSELAMSSSMKHLKSRWDVPAEIAEDSPAGVAARETVRENIYELNLHSYCCAGLNFGYFYDASPIIAYDGERAPTYDVYNYTPSTVPGSRMPHMTLPDGGSLYDTLGAGYTLFRNDPDVSVETLVAAAHSLDAPLDVVNIPPCPEHAQRLVLVRPDFHVAWRGDAVPQDALMLMQTLCGH